MPRKRPPDRRASWTQRAEIGGQTFYLGFGEYEDGTLAEVFLDAAKQGTFLRGVLGALSRTVSLALQCGAPVEEVVKILRGLDFPPNGPVLGSPSVGECSSVPDWIALEIERAYCDKGGGKIP